MSLIQLQVTYHQSQPLITRIIRSIRIKHIHIRIMRVIIININRIIMNSNHKLLRELTLRTQLSIITLIIIRIGMLIVTQPIQLHL
jgi:hypothetical protein